MNISVGGDGVIWKGFRATLRSLNTLLLRSLSMSSVPPMQTGNDFVEVRNL